MHVQCSEGQQVDDILCGGRGLEVWSSTLDPQSQPVCDRRGKQIALDVARGLHYLHSNSIMHLDLKYESACGSLTSVLPLAWGAVDLWQRSA